MSAEFAAILRRTGDDAREHATWNMSTYLADLVDAVAELAHEVARLEESDTGPQSARRPIIDKCTRVGIAVGRMHKAAREGDITETTPDRP